MRKFSFIPMQCEWRLIDDETHETLHRETDPAEVIYHEDGTPKTIDEIAEWFGKELSAADAAYSENGDYNGIWLREGKRLDRDTEMPAAARTIAETLYNYYIS